MGKHKEKEIKTNAMRILEKIKFLMRRSNMNVRSL